MGGRVFSSDEVPLRLRTALATRGPNRSRATSYRPVGDPVGSIRDRLEGRRAREGGAVVLATANYRLTDCRHADIAHGQNNGSVTNDIREAACAQDSRNLLDIVTPNMGTSEDGDVRR